MQSVYIDGATSIDGLGASSYRGDILLRGVVPHPPGEPWDDLIRPVGWEGIVLTELPEGPTPHWKGLASRRRLAAGCRADLLLFGPKIRDRATPEKPREAPEGLRWRFIAGKTVLRGGHRTGARPGGFPATKRSQRNGNRL